MSPRRRTPWRHAAAAAALTAVLALAAACTDSGPGPSYGKDDPLQTKAIAEVTALAQERVQAVAAAVGSPLDDWQTNTSPCLGRRGEIAEDGRWTLKGFAGLPVAPADQLTTLHRVRDMWRQRGYEITEDRTFDDGTGGAVSMRDQETAITISLTTSKRRDSIALILASGCYMPVAGEDPANA